MAEIGLGAMPLPLMVTDPPACQPVVGASRYLLAAAYYDASFRRKALELVRHSWYRGRAPEFGINEDAVIQHCRKAERQERVRDLLMLGAFVVCAHKALAWMISDPSELGDILTYFTPSLITAAIVAGMIFFAERLFTEQIALPRALRGTTIGDAAISSDGEKAKEKHQNLIVYGGYSPFVGSGYSVGGWSFSVNLENTTREFGVTRPAIPFDTANLLSFVENRLNRLRVDGLDHYEVLFADGRLVRDDNALFAPKGQPYRDVAPEIIAERADAPARGARSYLCINVPDWRGEIVVSIYLRFKRGESNLFAEASYFLLAPPKRRFYAVDEVDAKWRVATLARIFTGSSLKALIALALSLFSVLAWAQQPVAHWFERRRIRRRISCNPRFNFGATTSIRELGMENYFRVYFQQLDKDRHIKTVEQCVIDAIVEFLNDHNIDTSEIRDRRSAILNNGVIVSGGDINTQSLAVGNNARSFVSRLRSRPGRAPAAANLESTRSAA